MAALCDLHLFLQNFSLNNTFYYKNEQKAYGKPTKITSLSIILGGFCRDVVNYLCGCRLGRYVNIY